MLARRRQSFEVLSISSLDLFASALGVFILVAVLMFPYYLRQPSIETQLDGAREELSAAGLASTRARQSAEQATKTREAATTSLARARARLREAEGAAAQAEQDMSQMTAAVAAARKNFADLGLKLANLAITNLDLVFVMDTTGSMGNELRDIQISLQGIVRVLHRLAPTLNVGFVAYKDRRDAYVTKVFPLTPMNDESLGRILRFVQDLSAAGGGDYPEPVDQALQAAVQMPWRSEALGKIVVIGDAPVHAAQLSRTFEMAERFRHGGPDDALPRSVSSIFSGQAAQARRFFERLARAGGGAFAAHRGQMIESVLLSVLPARGKKTGEP